MLVTPTEEKKSNAFDIEKIFQRVCHTRDRKRDDKATIPVAATSDATEHS